MGKGHLSATHLLLLAVAMLVIWGACYATGQITAYDQDLTCATAKTALGGFHLAGLALAFGLMAAVRRYIAPTRV
jgi:hypothetical protein